MRGARVRFRPVVLCLLGAAAAPRARAQSVVVGPLASAMSAVPGASVTVPVVADMSSGGGASLGAIAARLTWHAGSLQLTGTGVGTFGSPVINSDSAAYGVLKFAVAAPAGATGMPVLLNASFSVTGPAADTSSLALSVTEITAAATFTNLLPITTTTTSKFCVSTGRWGDVDSDTTLTAHDALVIITDAVGLPILPYTVVNGDVDASGTVDTRDALIVLSAAVGIPVAQFRIGRLNSGACSITSAASILIQPRSATVATGDSLPVSATVRDSSGAITQGVNLVWVSQDTTVLRARAGGRLIAITPGATYAGVVVSPGIRDSILVTVTAARHVWYVNPVVAASNTVELGSQTYPFALIGTAIAAAAPSDTIHVATADYGGVLVGKPLVLLGDSSAGGFPRLSNSTGAALSVDNVLAGPVTVHGFRLLNSQSGAEIRLAQTLTLDAISVEGSRGLGMRLYGVDSLNLTRTAVAGAVGTGVALDSFRVALLDSVKTDLITAAGTGARPLGLALTNGGTLGATDLLARTAGVMIDSLGTVSLRRLRVLGAVGTALAVTADRVAVTAGEFAGATLANGGATPLPGDPGSFAVVLAPGAGATFDSAYVHDNSLFGLWLSGGLADSLRADSVVRNLAGPDNAYSSSLFGGFSNLAIERSVFQGGGPAPVYFNATGANVTLDSTVFDAAPLYAYTPARFAMAHATVRNGVGSPVQVYGGGVVSLDSVEVTGVRSGCTSCGLVPPAVIVTGADSTSVSRLYAHDNEGGALGAWSGRVLRVMGGSLLHNGMQPGSPSNTRVTLAIEGMADAAVLGLTVRDSADVGIQIQPLGNSRTVVDSSTLEGSGTLVQAYGVDSSYHDTVTVTRSTLTGFQNTTSYHVDAERLGRLVAGANLLDSARYAALNLYGVGAATATANQVRAWGSLGFYSAWGALVADSNAFVGCSATGEAILLYESSGSVVANTHIGCGPLVAAVSYSGPVPIEVRGNTLSLDTMTAVSSTAIDLAYRLGFVHVAGNAIVGGTSSGIRIEGISYGVDSARVDSNVVRLTRATGIVIGSQLGAPASLTYNLVADNKQGGIQAASSFQAAFNTVVRTQQGTGVSATGGGRYSYRLGNIAGNRPYGLVAAYDSGFAADSNFWGDSLGPAVVGGPGSTGDSIAGTTVGYRPFLTSAAANAPSSGAPPAVQVFRPALIAAQTVPPAPKPPAGVRPVGTSPRATRYVAPAPLVRPAPVVRRAAGGRP